MRIFKKRAVHFDYSWQQAPRLKKLWARGRQRRYTSSFNRKCKFAYKVSRSSTGPPSARGPIGSNRSIRLWGRLW